MLHHFTLPGLSNSQFAELVGKSARSVTTWRRKGMPSPKKDLAGAIRWSFDHSIELHF